MKRLFGAIVVLILFSGSVYGAQEKDPFNLRDVMERVAHHPKIDGEKITIGGEVYQATFDGSEVILTSRDGKHSYRIPIGEGAEPYIKDGRVCYETPDGEIQFRGTRFGLRYQRIINDPGFGKYLGDMAIRMKGRGDLVHHKRPSLSNAKGRRVPYRADQGNLWISQKDLASSQFPLNLGGEFLIDTTIVYVPAPDRQDFPSVAFDGTNYLVVWTDERSGWDIYACRVNPSGAILDPSGIYISTGGSTSRSVAFDGTNYLVVWTGEGRSGGYADIYGCRVSPMGTVLDPGGIAISPPDGGYDAYPSIAFDGRNYLVVWRHYLYGYDIYGCRVSPSGTVLDSTGIVISAAAGDQSGGSVAFDGTNYLVVWTDQRSGNDSDIYGCRVSPSGSVLDPDGVALSAAAGDQGGGSVAFDGTNYLVVWTDYSRDIWGCRVTPSLIILDPSGINISTEGWGGPFVSFDGTNYLVVWDGVYGRRVSPSGTVLDTADIHISMVGGSFPSVAFGDTNYLVVWEDRRNTSSENYSDIYGCRMSPSGTVLDSENIGISGAANSLWYPSAIFGNTNYLVVWEDYRGGSDDVDIYGCRVSPSGSVLDPACIPISTAAGYSELSPSVAFDGTNYLVVWADCRNGSDVDIYGCRVSQSGTVLDTAGFAVSTVPGGQGSPAVAFDGANYLVVWTYSRGGSDSDIYGCRIDQLGTVLDPGGIAISTAANNQGVPSVAFDGTNYLVVWEDYRSGSDSDIYGCRVSPAGAILEPAGIAISTAANNQRRPSVSFDGTNYLVVWQDKRSGGGRISICECRVSQSGTVLDPSGIAISTGPTLQESPSVAFDGTNYLVVWEDYFYDGERNICGCRIGPSGDLIDSLFTVTTQSGDQVWPTLAAGANGQILITYSGFTPYPYNAMRIWGKFYPFTGVEEEPTPGALPQQFTLEQNYPNPFNSTTAISYQLSAISYQRSAVSLKIYNILGREVRTLVDEEQPAGNYRVLWDGRDNSGKGVSSGVYFCRLKVKGERLKVEKTRKMVLLR